MSTLLENNREVYEAYQEYQRFTANPEMREKARQRQRFLEDYKIGMDAAEDQGLVRGIAIGEAKGEAKRNIETAVKMRSKGYKLSDISDITGLSAAEIERLG